MLCNPVPKACQWIPSEPQLHILFSIFNITLLPTSYVVYYLKVSTKIVYSFLILLMNTLPSWHPS